MNRKYPKSYYYIILALIIVTLLLILPVKFPYSMKTSGKLITGKEWIITKGDDGRIMTSLINHKVGVNQEFNVSIFERGDAVNFNLRPFVGSGYSVNEGDTIAAIFSNHLQEELTELKGNLLTEKAALASIKTGEKVSIIEEAEQRIVYAKTKVKEQEKIVERNRELFKGDLISEQDYEISVSSLELYKTDVDIANRQLSTVLSGEKNEEIKLIETRITAFETQINTLMNKAAAYNFISPVSGVVNRSFSQDTVLIINDTTQFVLLIPIPWEDTEYIKSSRNVKAKIPGADQTIKGVILNLSNSVHTLGGIQIRIATAVIDENISGVVPGLIVKCEIDCGELSPIEYILKLIERMFA